jgi:hypothetical protein
MPYPTMRAARNCLKSLNANRAFQFYRGSKLATSNTGGYNKSPSGIGTITQMRASADEPDRIGAVAERFC